MFTPFPGKSKFGPAFRAIGAYANAFDAEGNGWAEESADGVTFRVVLPGSDEEARAQVDRLEQRLQERDLRIAMGVICRRTLTTDGEALTIYVPSHRLKSFLDAINPRPPKDAQHYDISKVRT